MSTTAMYTGLSGLSTHSRRIEVIGNNIANVNTTAFKASHLAFETQLSRTISAGSEPGDTTGGVNPFQVGMGVQVGAMQRDTTQGSINATGDGRDLAIDGSGFFMVQRGNERLYTRDGSFRVDAENNLVSPDGLRVLGFLADESYNIVEGVAAPINIPLNALTIAEATSTVRMAGNLNAAGQLATRGSSTILSGTAAGGLSLIPGATVAPTAPNVIEATSLLAEIEDPLQPGSGAPLFSPGQSIALSGVERGGSTLPSASFLVEAASTLQDFLDFLTASLGIQAVEGGNPDGSTPGAALDPQSGRITVTGNIGTVNDLTIEAQDIRLLDANGDLVRLPFVSAKEASADGEAVRTSFVVYDSLGAEVEVNASFVLDSRSNAGTTWRYFFDSAADTDGNGALATGTISFDTSGNLTTTAPIPIAISVNSSGAATPLAFNVELRSDTQSLSALADDESSVASVFRDGSAMGVLQNYSVDADGTVLGAFSNAVVRPLARLAIAMFANDAGLVEAGSNLMDEGANSGPASVRSPGTFGAGRVVSGALEASNVDLGREFIDMILTSTGYSASSRVVRTADELMQQLLVLGR